MKYLLDTDVIINSIRGIEQVTDSVKKSSTFISSITLCKLVYGAHKSINTEKSLQQVKRFLRDISIEIINVDMDIAYTFGKIKADLERKGRRIEDFDLLIAATSIENKLTLVTNNKKHFSCIKQLKIYKG